MPRYATSYKRTSISSSTGAVSENAIVFSQSGGHSHDGQGSSLIDTTKYSIWDFPVNTVYSTTPRAARQAAHIEQFKNFVVNLVNTSVLEPAGVVLGDNVINANNIVAGSISSELIAANTIVANNIAANTITTDLLATDAITSLNYSYTSGNFSNAGTFLDLTNGQIVSEQFAIDSNGNAYFAGDISAASGTFTGDLSGSNISGGTIDIGGSDATSFHVNSTGNMWLGASTYASAPFKVSNSGALTATGATISGSVTATSGSFGAFSISGTKLTSEGSYPNNYMEFRNYGDLYIYSKPTSGGHSGQTWRTYAVGEWFQIERTDAGSQHFARLGNWWAGDGTALGLGYAGDEHAILSVVYDYGTLELRDTSNNNKIYLNAQYGDATFGRNVTLSGSLFFGSRHTIEYSNSATNTGYYGIVVKGQNNSTYSVRVGELYSAGGVHAPNSNLHLTGNSYVYIKGSGNPTTGGVSISSSGALSKNSGSFKIDHPLEEKSEDYWLYHSFIEGPYADLIYRGVVELVNGYAEVNIDTVSGMTNGTFVKLVNNVSCFTSNETSWDNVKGYVEGNILKIYCQNDLSYDTISWLVIGERCDEHMLDTEWTDENGRVIQEQRKDTA